MLSSSASPSSVPRVMASMALVACCGGDSLPDVGAPRGGTITAAITIAAGTLMIEAERMWPIASGTTGERMLA